MPAGQFATRDYLLGEGFGESAIRSLLRSGDILSLARGVYAQDEPLTVAGIARSLRRMGSDLVVGGETALRLHGVLPVKPAELFSRICLSGRDRPPGWMHSWDRRVRFDYLATSRLFRFGRPKEGLPMGEADRFAEEFGWMGVSFPISCVERALFEVLSEVPERAEFEDVRAMIRRVWRASSRPRFRRLLDESVNVKVNRLFLWAAEETGYRVALDGEISRYIGTGKRQLVKGGRYVGRYLMTVPRDFRW